MANEAEASGLNELRQELEMAGMVVVPFRDEIHVRRSTLGYVKVRVDGGTLRCQPCVGFLSQAQTTWLLLAVEAIVIPTFLLRFGATAVGLTAVFTGLLGFGFHALRYTLDEIAINRIQSAWLSLRARPRVAPAPAPTSSASAPPLALPDGAGPAQAVSPPQHVRNRN